jgi:hypothetical protein
MLVPALLRYLTRSAHLFATIATIVMVFAPHDRLLIEELDLMIKSKMSFVSAVNLNIVITKHPSSQSE